MRIKNMKTAIAAGTAALAGLAAASPALAAPVPAVQVPCRVSALASAISGASNGAVLRLASCTYVLTSALPKIRKTLTLQGARPPPSSAVTPGAPLTSPCSGWA